MSNKTNTDSAKHNETVDEVVPEQRGPVEAEVINLEEHMPTSLRGRVKNAVKNKKALAVAGGVVLGIVISVVAVNRRTTVVTEPAEDESASA
jgi:hypothetical protein